MKSFSLTRSPSNASLSVNIASDPIEPPHPFGSELAQVSELAEDYSHTEEYNVMNEKAEVRETYDAFAEEEHDLISKGFCKFLAEDYINDIQGFLLNAYGNGKSAIWI